MALPRSLPLVAAVLAVAILAVNVRLLAGGRTWADVRYHTAVAPPRLAAAAAVQAGELPAWWEGSGLGVPLAGEPAHGAMYPLGWLASSPRALDLLALVHLAWAALGVAVWARRRAAAGAEGASEPAALVAGLLLATSGIAASAAVRGALPALAHLPWIGAAAAALGAATSARARARAALALGGLLALVATAGVLALLADAIVLAIALAARRRTARWLAAALGAGLAIGAMQWLPALAQLGAGAGGEIDGLPLARLVELIVPGAFGADDPARAAAALAGAAPWAPSLFAGVPLLALAAVRTPPARALVAIVAFAALALIAGRGGWPAWLGAPELHAAALIAVLAPRAAAGVDALLAAERRAVIALGVGAACSGVALGALGALRARHPEAAPAIERALLDGGLGLLALALALVLAWRARGAAGGVGRGAVPVVLVMLVLPSVGAAPSTAPLAPRDAVEEPPPWAIAAPPAPTPAPRRVYRPAFMEDRAPGTGPVGPSDRPATLDDAMATLAGAAGWRWGLGAARSEDPARAPAHDAAWLAAAGDGGALLDRLGIDLAILPETLVGARYLTALSVRRGWALVAFPAAPPASVMRGALWAETPADALAQLYPLEGKSPRGTVVLAGSGPARPDREAPRPCEIRRWDAGVIDLRCTADATGGYAVVSSSAAPGWSAMIDGATVPWLTADVLRRAVPLTAGVHAVRWEYDAPLLGEGLMLALLGLLGLGALAVAGRGSRG